MMAQVVVVLVGLGFGHHLGHTDSRMKTGGTSLDCRIGYQMMALRPEVEMVLVWERGYLQQVDHTEFQTMARQAVVETVDVLLSDC